MNRVSIMDVRLNIAAMLDNQVVGQAPLHALIRNNEFINKECWIWDYKSQLPNLNDKRAFAKLVLQIASFYNSCGGYLIFGVQEVEKDIKYSCCGIEADTWNNQKVGDLIESYLGIRVDFLFSSFTIEMGMIEVEMGVLYIPKRNYSAAPAIFIRNSPAIGKKRLFGADDLYIRVNDKCVKADEKELWALSYSKRDYLSLINNTQERSYIDDQLLPDRSLICSNFIGRDAIISSLWRWLSDPLAYVKVLAGDGGKGKTSIAYEFCSDFTRMAPYGFERIIWLSAKDQQFDAMRNRFFELPQPSFSCVDTLLEELGEHCTEDSGNFREFSKNYLISKLRESLRHFPSLIVIDDLDSLNDADQKLVVDYCSKMGSEKVRFLITTRKQFSFSSDLCVHVDGLNEEEFTQYVKYQLRQRAIEGITTSQIKLLHSETSGSPLLSSSIIRLFRAEHNENKTFRQVLKHWKEQHGEDARDAAIVKEVLSLSRDSRRLLLALCYLGGGSETELKELTKFPDIKFGNCTDELGALFLMSEPSLVKGQKYYSIQKATSLVVYKNRERLSVEYKKLQKVASEIKKTNKTKDFRISRAFSHALSAMRGGDYDEAYEAIENALSIKPNNPDLLSLKAKYFMDRPEPDFNEARNLFDEADKNGASKLVIFENWYELSKITKDLDAMTYVVEKVLDKTAQSGMQRSEWRLRRAECYVLRSYTRGDGAPEDLLKASEIYGWLSDSKNGGRVKLNAYTDKFEQINDRILSQIDKSMYSDSVKINVICSLINYGDHREKLFSQCNASLLNFQKDLEHRYLDEEEHEKMENLYKQRVNEFSSVMSDVIFLPFIEKYLN